MAIDATASSGADAVRLKLVGVADVVMADTGVAVRKSCFSSFSGSAGSIAVVPVVAMSVAVRGKTSSRFAVSSARGRNKLVLFNYRVSFPADFMTIKSAGKLIERYCR